MSERRFIPDDYRIASFETNVSVETSRIGTLEKLIRRLTAEY